MHDALLRQQDLGNDPDDNSAGGETSLDQAGSSTKKRKLNGSLDGQEEGDGDDDGDEDDNDGDSDDDEDDDNEREQEGPSNQSKRARTSSKSDSESEDSDENNKDDDIAIISQKRNKKKISPSDTLANKMDRIHNGPSPGSNETKTKKSSKKSKK